MNLKRTLEDRDFPSRYQNHIDKIDLEKANDFVKAMLNSIVNKYGLEKLKTEIKYDIPNSPISNHLTHIIEVGGLKIISDNNLLVENNVEFQCMIVAVIFTLNCSLAIETSNLKVYNGPTSHYYNSDIIMELANRLARHTIEGKRYSKGFEYYSNIMIVDNLISKFNA